MNPELWRKVSSAFAEAAKLTPEQRPAFLDALAQQQPDVCDELRGLLDHMDEPTNLESISARVWDQVDTPIETSSQGQTWPVQVGPYPIEGKIGQGGMGLVLRGKDADFNRTLAVKLLAEQFAGHTDMKRRFVDEARLMGQLQHPGIPPVHDLGELPDGRPYYVMKMIEGRTLAELLNERRHPAQGGDNPSARDFHEQTADHGRFLQIFEDVCQTMAYAHSRGVLHRDLKPGNIMVGAFGEVQVMDWGLAKVLAERERTEMPTSGVALPPVASGFGTQPGQAMGTPAYMPPEQATGDIDQLDERTDVFALGAVLCCLLTGQPPYFGRSVGEVLSQAKQGHVEDAFQRLDDCGCDVELVELAKICLAPNKQNRLRDASAVAKAVAAYQAMVQERLKQAEIERAEAKIQAEEERKRREVEEAKTAAERAQVQEERRRRRVTVALAAALLVLVAGTAGAGFWYYRNQTLQAEAALQRRIETLDRKHKARAALDEADRDRRQLHQSLLQYRELNHLLNRPELWQAKYDTIHSSIQRTTSLLASSTELQDGDLQQRLQSLTSRLAVDKKEWTLATQLDGIRLNKAKIVNNRFGFALAEQKYKETFVAAGVDVVNGNWANIASRIQHSSIKWQLVAALDDWVYMSSRQTGKPLYQRLSQIARRVDPDPVRDKLRDPTIWNNPDALAAFAKTTLEDKETLKRLSPQTLYLIANALRYHGSDVEGWLRQTQPLFPEDFWLNFELAVTLQDKRKTVEAAGFYRAALVARPGSAAIWNNLGNCLRNYKDVSGAVLAFRKSLQINPRYAKAWNNLGNARQDQNNMPAAIDAYRKAIEYDSKQTRYWNNLGVAYHNQQNLKEAVLAYEKAIKCAPKNAIAHYNLGDAWREQKNFPKAEQSLRIALAINPKIPEAWNALANVLREQRQTSDALDACNKALKLRPRYAQALSTLGKIYSDQNNPEKSFAAFRDAVNVDPNNADAWFQLGLALQDRKQTEEAIAAYRQAIDGNPNDAAIWHHLGLALFQHDQISQSILAYQRSLKINQDDADAWYNLGVARHVQKDHAGAAEAYRRALKINGNLIKPQLNAALLLRDQGRFAEAAAGLQDILSRLPARAELRPNVLLSHKQCLQWLELQKKLPLVLAGGKSTNRERLALVNLCTQCLRRYQDSVSLYQTIFRDEPNLADDLQRLHRYQAACVAVLATNTDNFDRDTNARLRQQAHDWLRADLKTMKQLLQTKPVAAVPIHNHLQRCLQEPKLAGVRDKTKLADLSKKEQALWSSLWVDIAQLQKTARARYTETKLTGTLSANTTEQHHFVKLLTRRSYYINMHSTQFDTWLRLEDFRGKNLVENDHNASGNANSRIEFVPKEDGYYHVIATSYKHRGRGDYTILVREFLNKK